MNPLSAVFAGAVAVRNALYDRGLCKTHKLARPVVSVGNISVGGSGKTPFVVALGELLKQRGIVFDVLSRGYRRKSTAIAVVDPQGRPEDFGDEPLLIARKLQVPVIVGADRYQAGLLAEQKYPSQLHILDDGFQHRRLHRDFDIVMLPAADLKDTLLPVGRLREPLAALQRADAAVIDERETEADFYRAITDESSQDSLDAVERAMAEEEGRVAVTPPMNAVIWRARRELQADNASGKAIAFCGIARPKQFFAQLKELKTNLADTVAFPDHHSYSLPDTERLLQLKASHAADCFITTEKDLINLGALAGRLQPLRVAELRVRVEKPQAALEYLLSALEKRSGCRF